MNKYNLVLFCFVILITAVNANTYDISADVPDTIWLEDITNPIILINTTNYIVDSHLTESGNGHCNSNDGTSLTFEIETEDNSKVDCFIDSEQLKITAVPDFVGNSSCEVKCIGTTNQSKNFTISVIESINPDPVTVTQSSGKSRPRYVPSFFTTSKKEDSFELSPESIKINLLPGQGINQEILLKNNLNKKITINIDKNTLVSNVNIKNKVSIEPNSQQNLPIIININKNETSDFISGNINFDYNGEIKELYIVITKFDIRETERDEIPLQVKLGTDFISPTLIFTGEIDKNNVTPGTLLQPVIKLSEFKAKGIDMVSLSAKIYDSSNQIIMEYDQEINTDTDKILNIQLDDNIMPGNYAITFEAKYGDNLSKNTQTFRVVSDKDIIIDEILILTLILTVLLYSIHVIRKAKLTNIQ